LIAWTALLPLVSGITFAQSPVPSGTSTHVDVPSAGRVHFKPDSPETSVPGPFRLTERTFAYTSRLVRTQAKVRLYKVTFPSPIVTAVRENNTVHAEYFQPEGRGPFPACVVLHILGGDFLLSETIAQHLAHRGIAALFVKMPYYGERRGKNSPRRMISPVPAESVAGMTQGVQDIRCATAWLAERPEVNRERLGITGISLGGIMSALGAAGEPRLRNVAIVLGGGNLADLLWVNETGVARAFRENWQAEGGTRESFRKALLPIDPATYGHLLKGRRVLMIAAANDEVIPPESAKSLWESIGRQPELVWIDAGHYTAIRYLPRELVRLDRFFNARE
jgi:dienelactone hydrolase